MRKRLFYTVKATLLQRKTYAFTSQFYSTRHIYWLFCEHILSISLHKHHTYKHKQLIIKPLNLHTNAAIICK